MKKFLVLYMCPTSVLDKWMETPEEERKAMEQKMSGEWKEWAQKYKDNVIETGGAGKTTRITKSGAKDARNEIMMYSLVQADSRDAVIAMFDMHTHLGIPEAWIEVMDSNPLPGMQ